MRERRRGVKGATCVVVDSGDRLSGVAGSSISAGEAGAGGAVSCAARMMLSAAWATCSVARMTFSIARSGSAPAARTSPRMAESRAAARPGGNLAACFRGSSWSLESLINSVSKATRIQPESPSLK
jgi:hypothetical protein